MGTLGKALGALGTPSQVAAVRGCSSTPKFALRSERPLETPMAAPPLTVLQGQDALLVDIRSEAQRLERGVPELRRGALGKGAAVPQAQVAPSIRSRSVWAGEQGAEGGAQQCAAETAHSKGVVQLWGVGTRGCSRARGWAGAGSGGAENNECFPTLAARDGGKLVGVPPAATDS